MKYTLPLLTFLLTATTALFSLDPLEPGLIKLRDHKHNNGLDKTVSQEPKKHVTFAQQIDNIPTPEAKSLIIEASIPESHQPTLPIITPEANTSNNTLHHNTVNHSSTNIDGQEKKIENKMPGEIVQGKTKKPARAGKKQYRTSETDNVAKERNTQDNKQPLLNSVSTKQSQFVHTLASTIALCAAWDYIFSKTGTTDWVAHPIYTFTTDSSFAILNKISRAHIIYGFTAGAILLGAYKIIFSYCTPETEEELF